MLLETLRRKLKPGRLPQASRDVVESARSFESLFKGLDHVATRNEVALREVERAMRALQAEEDREAEEIRSGRAAGRSRRIALRRIQRLRRQMDTLEERIKILDANLHLHLTLMGKIQSAQAMELRGVAEEEVDAVLLEFETHLDEYKTVMRAGEVADGGRFEAEAEAEEEEALDGLEAEILGARSGFAEGSAKETRQGATPVGETTGAVERDCPAEGDLSSGLPGKEEE